MQLDANNRCYLNDLIACAIVSYYPMCVMKPIYVYTDNSKY